MNIFRTFFKVSALCALILCACDLQPKIASIPDDIGMFIEDRYPALLADPETQPEIYNSAVTDYGVYASPELYGSSSMDDYVLYASVDDYVLVPEEPEEIEVVANKTETESEPEIEIAEETDYLLVPTYNKNIVPEETEIEPKKETSDIIVVVKGDTVYSLARKNNMSIDEFVKINNLKEPYTLSIGQKLKTKKVAEVVAEKKESPKVVAVEKVKEIKEAKTEKVAVKEPVKPTETKRVNLQEITVQKGDTLYSLSRKYEIPVNDLAVMNKISSPFDLAVGQKIKVPKLDNVKTVSVSEIKTVAVKQSSSAPAKITPAKKVVRQAAVQKETKTAVPAKTTAAKAQNMTKTTNTKKATQTVLADKSATQQTQQKISSNPKKQLPKVAARSSSKFSWPVRGKILSAYGAKNNGLFNDGINISVAQGALVKAAENGVVAYAGNEVKGMGNLIIIQHSDGWMTVYAHLDSMSVKRGARVNVGTPIGRVGKTGKVDKPQLHFEIRKGTKAYNPTKYLKN